MRSLAEARGIFFDLYGTLFLYGDMRAAWEDWLRAIHAGLGEHGQPLPLDELSRACDGFFTRPEPLARDDGLTVFERRFEALCTERSWDLERAALEEIVGGAVEAWHRHIEVDPAAADILEALAESHTLALVSNFDHPPEVHARLVSTGLGKYFEAVVISGEVGVQKPDPAIFRPALVATKLAPEEVCYVGDTAGDVAGAQAAGLTPVLLRRPEGSPGETANDFRVERTDEFEARREAGEGTIVISSLHELLELA